MPPSESALVILVPEAEGLVKPFREAHDPSAAVGVPAHITLLYPFKPPDEIDAAVLDGLTGCFAGVPPFDFRFETTRRFPQTLYLVPEPAEPFRRLTRAIWQRHPETPPYGGRHPDIVPHLSLADRVDAATLDRVEAAFSQAARGALPLRAHAADVALLENRTGRWQIRAVLPLGA